MELLIPGLILVALMVWASTKIKRSAAQAYAAESIETEYFAIEKPDGLIDLAEPEDGVLFSARSKDLGRDEAEDLHHVVAKIEFFSGETFGGMKTVVSQRGEKIMSETPLTIGGARCLALETEALSGMVRTAKFYRWIEAVDGIFQLAVVVLADHRDEYSERIESMAASFRIKNVEAAPEV